MPIIEVSHVDAYDLVLSVYRKSPGKSWRRLNDALHDALTTAITAHLSFLPDDFAAIENETNGGCWMGNSEGSITGERYYAAMIKCGHTPACISFERYAGRPAALWCESLKTPERLCLGKRLTWRGMLLEVTNMHRNHLIACSYSYTERTFGEGSEVYVDGYRVIERMARLETGLVLHLGEARERENRRPERIVGIPYAELAAERERADFARKIALAAIGSAETLEALNAVKERLSAAPRGTYRHFDIEDIRKATQGREEAFRRNMSVQEWDAIRAGQLQRWQAGEDVPACFRQVKLRVRGKYVETSTGKSVSVESVKALLPLVPAYRQRIGAVTGHRVDTYAVESVSEDGVKIGCTTVPWVEIERLPELLEASCA